MSVVGLPDDGRPDERKIAEPPLEALPKSKAALGLVANVSVLKRVDPLPLSRQEPRYGRSGFSVARAAWCAGLTEAADVLTPLLEQHTTRVLSASVVNADPGTASVSENFLTGPIWAYVSKRGVVDDASTGHSLDGPLAFPRAYRGLPQWDAYAGYYKLS